MANRSKLAEILGLEEDEEFTIKGEREGERATYRIHNGRRECKDDSNVWCACGYEPTLTKLINDPSLIIHKPRFTDEEMTFLRLLHKYGKVTRITRSGCATYFEADGGDRYGNNIGELLKPDETIDLNEMFGSIEVDK